MFPKADMYQNLHCRTRAHFVWWKALQWVTEEQKQKGRTPKPPRVKPGQPLAAGCIRHGENTTGTSSAAPHLSITAVSTAICKKAPWATQRAKVWKEGRGDCEAIPRAQPARAPLLPMLRCWQGGTCFLRAAAGRPVWWQHHLFFPGPRMPGAAPHNPNLCLWRSTLSWLPAQQRKQLLHFPYHQGKKDDLMATGKD